MHIVWEGPVYDPSGYGSCARAYVRALHDNGIKCSVLPVSYYREDHPMEDKEYFTNLILNRNDDANYIHVEHKTPDILTRSEFEHSIGYTVWETNKVTPTGSRGLRTKDVIWTASNYSASAFRNSGYQGKIRVIPHIIDASKFKPAFKVRDKLTFLFVGEFTHRKGIDILLRAYINNFSKNDDVELIIKTYLLNGIKSAEGYIHAQVQRYIKEANKGDQAPSIKVIASVIDESVIPKLYSIANVFVYPTRGEGFGIPIAEAMAAGCLTIVPNQGGHMDFCSNTSNVLMKCGHAKIPDSLIEPGREAYAGQEWIDTEIEVLADSMKSVYHSWGAEKYVNMMKKARYVVEEQLSTKAVINKIREAVSIDFGDSYMSG